MVPTTLEAAATATATTIPNSRPTALPLPDGLGRPTAREHARCWTPRPRPSATISRVTKPALRQTITSTSIPSHFRLQTQQLGLCCKAAPRRRATASAVNVTSTVLLSRRFRMCSPILRLASTSSAWRTEPGREDASTRISHIIRILYVLRGCFGFPRTLNPELDHHNARCGLSPLCPAL